MEPLPTPELTTAPEGDLDAIVALATPWGRSAIALIRLSGADALTVARRVCPGGSEWRPRRASLRKVMAGDRLLDQVLAVWMPGPRTYTGEDSVELGCHGNPVIISAIVEACVAAGARPARPGEFTRQAFVNGRMDLTQVEALAALIEARTAEGVRLAQEGLDGSLSDEVRVLREALLDSAAELEGRLDHPGEDLGYRTDAEVVAGLERVAQVSAVLAGTWRTGRLSISGARVALVGPVNSGKSSLFNHLVGEERALVSAEPGTTRDVVERTVVVDGVQITFLDTAGERAEASGLEAAGQDLGRRLTADVELRLVVLPLHQKLGPEARATLAHRPPDQRIVVGTHSDLETPFPRLTGSEDPGNVVETRISNRTGWGIDDLIQSIVDRVRGETPSGAKAVLLSQRQHDLFRSVERHALAACDALMGPLGPAVAAEEATRGLERLAEIAGFDAREDVLDRLFSRFCIGK